MSASNISIHQSIKLYSHNTPQFISTQPYFSITYTQSKRQSQVHIHIPYKHNLQLSSCLHPYIYIYIYIYIFPDNHNMHSTSSLHQSMYIYIFSVIHSIHSTPSLHPYVYRSFRHLYSIGGNYTDSTIQNYR